MNTGRTPKFIIVDEHQLIGPELLEQLERFKEATHGVIIVDSLSALEDKELEFYGHLDQIDPITTRVAGAGFNAALLGARNMGKNVMANALARLSLSMAYMEPMEDWYQEDKFHNWKDFIQNPARPGRQIKQQRAPKQSFKAQMRSVNRNR